MKPHADAQRDVLEAMRPLPVEAVPLWSALGLALAEDVVAPHDVPPFPNSAMDGYAVRAEDVAVLPAELAVSEDVPAGHVARGRVEPGTAIKIMTGAPLPPGADTVVKVEDTEPGVGKVRILAAEPRANVRRAGGDVEAGTVVFEAGTRLTPPHLGSLATIGVAAPSVRRRPRVAILSTGDEVVAPDTAELGPGMIRDANRPLLTGLLTELGAEVIDLGIVGDDADLLRSSLTRGAEVADAVVTSGGVSMGEYDLVKAVLAELGDVEFWKVAMQPGKPFAFGHLGETPLFGLPGNPVSVLVAFEQFLRPGLLTMMGSRYRFRPRIPAVAGERFTTDPAKVVFLRVTVSVGDGQWVAMSAGGQASNVLSAAAVADAFAVIGVGTAVVEAGDPITLEMFRWPENREKGEW